jgi:hypothetical protein
MILLDFVAANICVYFQYLFMHEIMHQYFWRSCFNLRFKINVVVMIIRSLELLLILSEPFRFPPLVYPMIARLENKGCVQPHLFSSYLRLRRVALEARTPKWLSTEGNCFTAVGFPSNPIPVLVCAEHYYSAK